MKTDLFVKSTARLVVLLTLLLGGGLGKDGALTAQNTVKVWGLKVNAGTVTFNVSWDEPNGAETLWTDSAWVFVDYNKNGAMTRLPLEPGGTLLAHSSITSGKGELIPVAGNDKGAWVTGNARDAGSFTAMVQLLTKEEHVAGACAYGSNFPPVGKFSSATDISFTGTRIYEITLAHSDKTESIVHSGEIFKLPCGATINAFTDATDAPGILMPATYTLSGAVCTGSVAALTLSGSQQGWQYQLYRGGAPVGSVVPGTGGTLTFSDVSPVTEATTYTVRTVNNPAVEAQCAMLASDALDITINPLPASLQLMASPATICAGQSATLTASATGATSFKIDGVGWQPSNTFGIQPPQTTAYTLYAQSDAGCSFSQSGAVTVVVNDAPTMPSGLASNVAVMNCFGQPATLTVNGGSEGSGAVYEWGSGNVEGENMLSPATTTAGIRMVSLSTASTYWVRLRGTGVCSAEVTGAAMATIYTEPEPVGTFAGFSPSAYSSSTYLSLIDERDGKPYPVVKIADRWIMARNLNYQKDLTWQGNSSSPSTDNSGGEGILIGNFWCPGGTNSAATSYTATASTRASCDVWGALYPWETAMSFDGLGAWTEVSDYHTGRADGSDSNINWGRTGSGTVTGGSGICPLNWHVPTDNDWGVILDGMESSGGTVHQHTDKYKADDYVGVDAGSRAKSKCTTLSDIISDTRANWAYNDGTMGTDYYSFRVLPAGARHDEGDNYFSRGFYAFFWTSTPRSKSYAWHRHFDYKEAGVSRGYPRRSHGYSVRCIRN
jgi:uncharacterized protein (TIGR02145 family)